MTAFPETTLQAAAGSPFDLDDTAAYVAWRTHKLAAYPQAVDELRVAVAHGGELSGAELGKAHRALQRANFFIYHLPEPGGDKPLVRQLGRRFGLERLDNNLCADDDGISSLRVVERRREGEYIPYTNKRLNWHTDGYYNRPDEQIRAVILHCVQPAATGGESALLDHEIAYILLRDADPELVRALMAPDAMRIPPNVQDGRVIRPAQGGPVFSVDSGGHLHMRYSARARNIDWKGNSTTHAAAEFLLNLFQQDSPYIFRHQLKSGEGILGNNVLHCRTSFEDDPAGSQTRLLYRARYFDRVVDMRNQ
ncbi:MAG TPA: taurine catabolism dioxygenase TauD [Gammaproteobacteria bacterium]|nr:taurine catabolism dioxygenase TauD [Gammaproteobacteria bacterium]